MPEMNSITIQLSVKHYNIKPGHTYSHEVSNGEVGEDTHQESKDGLVPKRTTT